ncbi:EAL domain-containing protein [Mycolicibacterium sp. S2-37]|uniref:putative bifunctional diguanylate cyclase/phosphodiesterase n=1 Tax=Mycolicibacterium sp. S2-37 TaxID=2810297 RepID=UPI001A95329C|nr:EAL domain-containing protein [Mycolicibacterium sp. S2-37]MBO0677504.1 EAL domain-containing protein [Mycolicibacterium sp. S2-37]
MAVRGYQQRLVVFGGVLLLWSVNALGPHGDVLAGRIADAIQVVITVGAMICGLAVARRMSGILRWWRLLIVGALACWLLGEVLWWAGGGEAGVVEPPAGVVAYFLFPVLALGSLLLLARAGQGVIGRLEGSTRLYVVTLVLDGLVAILSFSIFVLIAELGVHDTDALPRSGNQSVQIAYVLLESGVVVVAIVMAMVYRPNRPYRANGLLLTCGVVAIAASDRLIAYLHSLNIEDQDLWVGVGFIVGPLLIAFSVLDLRPRPRSATDGSHRAMDWAQLILPYGGFLGTAVLFAFHLLVGEVLELVVVLAALTLILLVASRQVVAMRAQWLLTLRLFQTQRKLAHQVNHDALTGLPNRLLFAERLQEAIEVGRFVLIFVDLDDFKEVNDRFGHAAGDDLLCAVGERLQRCMGENDTLARIGGDEFAILIDGVTEPPEVVADRLRVALREPFAVHGSAVRVRASMGLVRPATEGPAPTSDDLLRQADISMYAGKRSGKDTAVVYQPSSGATTSFPTALRQADGGTPSGFRLVYQPVVRLADGVPIAVEALARWTAPNGMEIPPETFVASAEAAGLGATLDLLVLELACREVREAGLQLAVHVNVGAARLGNREFTEQVRQALLRHDLAPERLVVEITETVPIVDLAEAAAEIQQLNAAGIRVALDDFGAGYNSLTYLHALPVQIIKLDRGLAVGADPNRDVTLYRSVIGLCDALGLDVIAEGIESDAQRETVMAAGCRFAQGHLFGRPVPIDRVGAQVAREDTVEEVGTNGP